MIGETARKIGVSGYIKGGVPRDYASNFYNGTNLVPKDLDIMLTGGVNKITEDLVARGAIIRLRRNRKKTPVFEIDLPIKNGLVPTDLGIVLARGVTYQRDQVVMDLITDDSLLSDFTINAMFLPIGADLDISNFIDPLGGLEDIKKRLVRMVAPNTFIRNPECMLRAIRMVDHLGATLEGQTVQAIKKDAPRILRAPPVVIQQNLEKILSSPRRNQNMELMNSLGLTEYLTQYL